MYLLRLVQTMYVGARCMAFCDVEPVISQQPLWNSNHEQTTLDRCSTHSLIAEVFHSTECRIPAINRLVQLRTLAALAAVPLFKRICDFCPPVTVTLIEGGELILSSAEKERQAYLSSMIEGCECQRQTDRRLCRSVLVSA